MGTGVPQKYRRDPRRHVMEGGTGVGATRRFNGAGEDAANKILKMAKVVKSVSETVASENLSFRSTGKCHLLFARWTSVGTRSNPSVLLMGAEQLFQRLDARFPDLEAHDKIGEQSYAAQSIDHALRATFPHNLGHDERVCACVRRER